MAMRASKTDKYLFNALFFILVFVVVVSAFSVTPEGNQYTKHTHGFRLDLQDFVQTTPQHDRRPADALTMAGYPAPGSTPQATVGSGWSPRLLTEFGFGPGHNDFEMILDHARHLVARHMAGASDVPSHQRLPFTVGMLDNMKSLEDTVRSHLAQAKAKGRDGLSGSDHLNHAGHRLALSLALQLKEDTATETKQCSGSDADSAVADEVEASDTTGDAGSVVANAAVEELGDNSSTSDEESDDDWSDASSLDGNEWSLAAGSVTKWQDAVNWSTCSRTVTEKEAASSLRDTSLEGDSDASLLLQDFATRLMSRLHLMTACPCKLSTSQQWKGQVMASDFTREPRRSASHLDLICFGASDPRMVCPQSPFQAYDKKICACYHRPLLHSQGPKAAWLSEEAMVSTGIAKNLRCTHFISNPAPVKPPPSSQPAGFWRACARDSCVSGTGAKCGPEATDAMLRDLKSMMDTIAPLCRCNAAKKPKYATGVHKSTDGMVCLKAANYNNECPAILPRGVCMCFKDGRSLTSAEISAVQPGLEERLGCGRTVAKTVKVAAGGTLTRMKVAMKEAFDEYKSTVKARTRSLLDAANKLGSLVKYKWESKLFGFPDISQSLTLKAVCSPVGDCVRYLASFSAQVVAFIFSFVADIVRVVLIAIKALLSLTKAGRMMLESADNTFRGGSALVDSIVASFKKKLHDSDEARLASLGAFNDDSRVFDAIREDDVRMELSRSLVPGTDAQEASTACSECTAEIEIGASVPLGPIPNPLQLGVDITFAPEAAPTMSALTLGRLKQCRKCHKATRLFLPPGVSQHYIDAYAKSCNPTTVGLCTILATQRRLRIDDDSIDNKRFPWDSFFFQSNKGGGIKDRRNKKDRDGQRFCKKFEKFVFVDLYRDSKERVGLYSDINCGTPKGTPTPGMHLAEICYKVEEMIEAKDTEESCWFKNSESPEPYDYMTQCMELMQCTPYNGIEHEKEIAEEANKAAFAKLESRFKGILMEAQVHYNKRQDTHIEEFSRMVKALSDTSHGEFNAARLRMAKARADTVWKHSPAMLFSDYRWSRPECLNVRASTDSELDRLFGENPPLTSSGVLFRDLHSAFIDRIQQVHSGDNHGGINFGRGTMAFHCPEFSHAEPPKDLTGKSRLYFSYVWCVVQHYRRAAIRAMGDAGAKYVDDEMEREEDGAQIAADLMADVDNMIRDGVANGNEDALLATSVTGTAYEEEY